MSDLATFQARLGYTFRNVELLRLALTHPSVTHEQGSAVEHNQRLEFLGDSVLSLVLTRELYEKFPAFDEGPLTQARAQMVNQTALAAEATRLDLGRHLILGRGEETNGGRARPSILADAFEALLGAVFLDGGYDAAREFILRQFRSGVAELDVLPVIHNPKGDLQELLQASSPVVPDYELISASGPDHDRQFECAVRHLGVELARGQGKSKRAAESAAAYVALMALRNTTGKAAGV